MAIGGKMTKVAKEKNVIEVEANLNEVEETKEILTAPPKPERVKIIISESDGDDGQADVFLSVNGKAYTIKRGFEVEVPPEVVEVLEHAVTTKMVQNATTFEMSYKNVPRYAYQVVG
jgi:hypothetical protein